MLGWNKICYPAENGLNQVSPKIVFKILMALNDCNIPS